MYDKKGWHPIPYLDQGEFYSEFGSFDVKITVPYSYVVGATGILQNADELAKYKELGKNNNIAANKLMKYASRVSNGTKTLVYKGENIHDYAWVCR
ncbi:MAG: hypothetical protein WDO71_03515 [Bacteroidota bacterium]